MTITGWNEMPVGVLMQIDDINQLHISEQEKDFQTAALLNGLTYDEFLELPISESKELIERTEWIRKAPKPAKVKKEYVLNGQTYTLFRDMGEMTTAQFIDYQAAFKPEIKLCIGELMAIALIPKGKKYNDGYNHQDVVDTVEKYLNVEEALGIADFFIKQCAKSIKRLYRRMDTLTIMAILRAPKEKKQELKQARKTLRKIMEGYQAEFGSTSSKM